LSDPTLTPSGSRWPRFDPSRWPLVLWHHPVLVLIAFVLGGAMSFAYSYAPLHRAKDWRIEHLETRLASRNEHTRELERQLALARKSLAGAPAAEALAALETRLDEATSLAASRAKDISSLERKLDQARKVRADGAF
jgi:hypothetical protein